jgi:hypothetical protein
MADRRDTAELFTLADLAERMAGSGEQAGEPEGAKDRGEDAPPPDPARRVGPFVFGAGAAVALGLAAVVLLQPHEMSGTPVARPPAPTAPAPAPTSTAPVPEPPASLSVSAPTATAQMDNSTVETTDIPAGAGRRPGDPAPTQGAPDPGQSWRDFLSSVISSYENAPGRHGPPRR